MTPLPTRNRLLTTLSVWAAAAGLMLASPVPAASLSEGAKPAGKCVQITLRSEEIVYRNRCGAHVWFQSLYQGREGTGHHQGYLPPRGRLSLAAAGPDVRVPVRLGAYRNRLPDHNRLQEDSPAGQAAQQWAINHRLAESAEPIGLGG